MSSSPEHRPQFVQPPLFEAPTAAPTPEAAATGLVDRGLVAITGLRRTMLQRRINKSGPAEDLHDDASPHRFAAMDSLSQIETAPDRITTPAVKEAPSYTQPSTEDYNPLTAFAGHMLTRPGYLPPEERPIFQPNPEDPRTMWQAQSALRANYRVDKIIKKKHIHDQLVGLYGPVIENGHELKEYIDETPMSSATKRAMRSAHRTVRRASRSAERNDHNLRKSIHSHDTPARTIAVREKTKAVAKRIGSGIKKGATKTGELLWRGSKAAGRASKVYGHKAGAGIAHGANKLKNSRKKTG